MRKDIKFLLGFVVVIAGFSQLSFNQAFGVLLILIGIWFMFGA